ncbi:MAG: gamma carbonic anhydrase family protein [Candidatus Rifleibacteriota bacterium]
MIRKFEDFFPQIPDSCFVAPSTEVIGNVKLGENVGLWYGSVIRGDINWIEIGDNTNIQDSTVIHVDSSHDDGETGYTIIGRNVTVGHRALIHACSIEDDCLIGMGAIILSGAKIGRGSIIAAGALVKENEIIPPGSLVVGLPGKIKGKVNLETLEKVKQSAKKYVKMAHRHKVNVQE